MKKLLIATLASCFALTTAHAEGEQPHHLISVGTDGIGWSGLSTVFNRDKNKSGIKDQDTSDASMKLNYNYIFESRVMIGAELDYEHAETNTKRASGTKDKDESTTSTIAVSVGYNFNEDLYNSWWIKGSLGSGRIDSKTKDSTVTPSNSETKVSVGYFTIEGGKRISLAGIGLKNVTYSPSLAITSASYGKDADDAGLKSSTSAQINVIKFDILF